MLKNTYKNYPNEKGYFGNYGGRYVSETLMPLILEVEECYNKIKDDKEFLEEFTYYLENYIGRPSPLFFAERITADLNGPKIYFKRDELNHTGAHKINNCLGQILLAKKMGKKWVKQELSLKLVPDNMGLRQQLFVLFLGFLVIYTWAQKILKDKNPMFLE